MRATLPTRHISPPTSDKVLDDQHSGLRRLLRPLLDLTENSDFLIGGSVGEFIVGETVFQIPRFTLMGPAGGGDTIRLGIFATIHGDEPEGAEALVKFLQELEMSPQTARGYHIYVYPVCNPSGFIAQTRRNAAGEDLSKQFWNKSSQPEVYYLEREMGVLRFQGVVSIHTEIDSDGFTVNTSSPVLKRELAQPAIQAAQRFLPGSLSKKEATPDLPSAKANAFSPNFLTDSNELSPIPFELHIGIPKQAPKPSQIHGTMSALKSILDSYRNLLSISQNI